MIRVVSLFCGIGCADLGLYAAASELGIEVEVVDAIDSWPEAVAVYNANLPHPVARVADVKALSVDDLPPHDLVIGGPPCQPFSLAGKRQGHDDPRNCLPDFLRLSAGSPWLMENVIARLIAAPFAVKLNAFDFGDVTTRKRWFYSDHLLHVIPTPGPRRFGDIRDHEADRRAIGRRFDPEKVSTYADAVSSLTAHAWHGHDTRSNVKLVGIPDDGAIGSMTGMSYHRDLRSGVQKRGDATLVAMRSYPKAYSEIPDDGALGSVTSHTHDQPLKVGLRGHSASASASAFEDDEPIGSLVSNSWHGNEISRLGPSVRCPSLLEMARAHSIPDSFDWVGATKTARGKMIANSWPVGMATAVCRAMLVAMGVAEAAA